MNDGTKKLLFVGYINSGKTTAANFLCKKRVIKRWIRTRHLDTLQDFLDQKEIAFSNDLDQISDQITFLDNPTNLIDIIESDDYKIFDSPGFDEKNEDNFTQQFYAYFSQLKQERKFDHIIFVVKFANNEFLNFTYSATKFYDYFGPDGLSRTVLLCSSTQDENFTDFNEVLHKSDGYKYLFERNRNKNIKHYLWAGNLDLSIQNVKFYKILEQVDKVDDRSIEFYCHSIEKSLTAPNSKCKNNELVSSTENNPKIDEDKSLTEILKYLNPQNMVELISAKYKLTGFFKSAYIITGTSNKSNQELFLKKHFPTEFKNIDLNKTFFKTANFYMNCHLSGLAFKEDEFGLECNRLRASLTKIYLIENLNPRPETLFNDLTILARVFHSTELKKKLEIQFTNGQDIGLIRQSVLSFNVLFQTLGIDSLQDKENYVKNNIFLLN